MLRVRDIFLFPFGWRGDVDYIHPSAWGEVRRWGRWLLAFYAALIAGSILLGTDVVLWVWFIPLLVGLPFLRLYLLCEHTLCPNSDDGFANTRTTLSNPVVRFLMWNLPYHAEHHLFPNIAFHHLPEAHRHLRPHLKYVAKGYIQVQGEIVRSPARTGQEGVRSECGDLPLQRGGRLRVCHVWAFGTLRRARQRHPLSTSHGAHHSIEWLVPVEHCLDQPLFHRRQHVHQRLEFIAVEHTGRLSAGHDLRQRYPAAPPGGRAVRSRSREDGLWLVDGRAAGLSLGGFVRRGRRAHRRQLRLGENRAAQLRLPRRRAHGVQVARPEHLRAMGRIYAGWALTDLLSLRCGGARPLAWSDFSALLGQLPAAPPPISWPSSGPAERRHLGQRPLSRDLQMALAASG
jgi:hypothetical protein